MNSLTTIVRSIVLVPLLVSFTSASAGDTDDATVWHGSDDADYQLIREVIADSQTRVSLQGVPGEAGWYENFYVSSADGLFTLKLGGQMQYRYVYNHRHESNADDDRGGFEIRRAKLWFKGNLFSDQIGYKMSGEFSRSSGAFSLSDAYMTWNSGHGWQVKAGQFKLPLNHEELVSSTALLTAERSFVNALTSGTRSQGVEFEYERDRFRFQCAVSDGFPFVAAGPNGTNRNTPFNDGLAEGSTEWAFTARAEYMLTGSDWDQFKSHSSLGHEEFGALVGGAIHWQTGEYGSTDGGVDEIEILQWTVDASIERDPWNIAGWIVGTHSDPNSSAMSAYDQYGLVLQGGFFTIPETLELFSRWEWYDFDGAAGGDDTINLFTVGANYYIDQRGHNWKWTNDLIWAMDPIPAQSTSIGLLQDAPGQNDQIVFRSMMQILF